MTSPWLAGRRRSIGSRIRLVTLLHIRIVGRFYTVDWPQREMSAERIPG